MQLNIRETRRVAAPLPNTVPDKRSNGVLVNWESDKSHIPVTGHLRTYRELTLLGWCSEVQSDGANTGASASASMRGVSFEGAQFISV
jgi:hypothetical protein